MYRRAVVETLRWKGIFIGTGTGAPLSGRGAATKHHFRQYLMLILRGQHIELKLEF